MVLVNDNVKKDNVFALEHQKRNFINIIEQKVPRKYLELMYYNLKTFYAEFDDDYLIIKKDTDFFNKMKRLDEAVENKYGNKEIINRRY